MKTFLEIGSCDFNTLNYLSDHGWKGVILEPIKKYLDNLERKPNVEYENSALTEIDGTTEMWVCSDELIEKDPDYRGMNCLWKGNDNHTETVEVNTITFDTLFKKYNLEQIDYLKVDVEAYDLQVLCLFPFNKVKPNYIQAECKHANTSPYMKGLLESHGYHVTVDKENLYAIKL
tara:strand:- start:375 stop:899 length:525 start_codon:yes stop_codon:yes gene_type:complete